MKCLLLIIICLLSCAQVSYAEDANKLLSGTWSSKCASDDTGRYNIETFKFSGDTAAYSIKTFTDSACKKLISTMTNHRTFKLGDQVSALQAHNLDYTFKSVTYAVNDKGLLKEANQPPGFYQYTHWQLNQARDVSGLKKFASSTIEHEKGKQFFTIVRIEGNKLYMGDYSSGIGDSENTRLSALYNVPFIKQ